MPIGVGHAEPVALTLALDDWARSTARWAALIGARPTIVDLTEDGRKRARFSSRSFATMDLIEAGLEIAAGDCQLVLKVPNPADQAKRVKKAGGKIETDVATGDPVVPAKVANGIRVRFTDRRPKQFGQAMMALPYVLDLSVENIRKAAPIWDAIMGVKGTSTSIETDSARQFEMRHYVAAGEAHAIGLMRVPSGLFLKRDSLGSSHKYVLATHGEGVLCLGFLFKEGLDAHIAALSPALRDLLLFEVPRSYQMGRNNITHADQTGGVSVIIAQHFEGWDGDPRGAAKA